MIAKQLMTSARTKTGSDTWSTPRWLFERIQQELEITFDLDAAASDENALCAMYFTESPSGGALAKNARWIADHVWCNPPYSMLKQFIRKAEVELMDKHCESVTFLILARTDTVAFHEASKLASAIYFLKGRVKFVGATSGAPFPSCVVHMTAPTNPRNPVRYREVEFVDWREPTVKLNRGGILRGVK